MITVSDLSKRYGGFTAVDHIDFVCRPGRVTGFLGPNGAGKTPTLPVMAGLDPAIPVFFCNMGDEERRG